MRSIFATLLFLALAISAPVALAVSKVTVNQIDEKGIGKAVGTIAVSDGKSGVVLDVKLKGLPPGAHGFHVHQNGDCGPKEKDGKNVAGLAAGGHHDPSNAGKHEGPKGAGHLGDLPALTVGKDGSVSKKITAPRLKLADLQGRSIMIHAGGDNYSDEPKPLGGGGARIACGVVK